MKNALVNVGLFIFLIISGFFIIVYFELLYDKIARPEFRNMSPTETFFFGLLIGLIITIDYFILKKFVRLLRGLNKDI